MVPDFGCVFRDDHAGQPRTAGKGIPSNMGNLQALYPGEDVNLPALAVIFVNSGTTWLLIKKVFCLYISLLSVIVRGLRLPYQPPQHHGVSLHDLDRSMQSVPMRTVYPNGNSHAKLSQSHWFL